MADTITVYLEKIKDEELYIFYNINSYSFEVIQAENIQLLKEVIKKFPDSKKFIEDTKEEFTESGRSSDDLSASFLKINHKKYIDTIKEIELCLIKRSKVFENRFKETRRIACASFSELCKLFNFFTRFEDLRDKREYSSYAYYVIDDNGEA